MTDKNGGEQEWRQKMANKYMRFKEKSRWILSKRVGSKAHAEREQNPIFNCHEQTDELIGHNNNRFYIIERKEL